MFSCFTYISQATWSNRLRSAAQLEQVGIPQTPMSLNSFTIASADNLATADEVESGLNKISSPAESLPENGMTLSNTLGPDLTYDRTGQSETKGVA